MYKIERYKSVRKPILKETSYTSHIRFDYLSKRGYEQQKDFIDTAYDIKTLTIDTEDILQMQYSEEPELKKLYKSYIELEEDFDQVIIQNNNRLNQEAIYKIIKADWLLDEDKVEVNVDSFNDEIIDLNNKYNNTNNTTIKQSIRKRLLLISYCIEKLSEQTKKEKEKTIIKGLKFFK